MQFDEILHIIGEFGIYQKRTLLIQALITSMVGFHLLSIVIFLAVPNHRCKIPEYPNDTFEIQNEYHHRLINLSIPMKTLENNKKEYVRCEVFSMNNSVDERSGHKRVTCNSWVYDKSVFKSTFATENNLVCDQAILTTSASMVVFAGLLFGSFFFGWLSDILGRKKIHFFSLLILFLSTMGLAWAPEFYSFCILRFIVGASCIGLDMTSFVLGIEITGPSRRAWIAPVKLCFIPIGLMILIAVSYLISNWKYVEIIGSAPLLLVFPCWWIIPESPRWLLNRGRREEAKEILRSIMKVNGTKVTEKVLNSLEHNTARRDNGKVWQLFASWRVAYRMLIIYFIWMVAGIVYYGISLNTRNLFGNFYLNFVLSAIAEFPGNMLCLVLLNRIGRRTTHASVMIIGGVSCLATIYTSLYLERHLQPLTIFLGLLGKVGATAAFAVIFTWASEVLPTVVRNAGMGIGSSCGSIGALVSPFITDLSRVIDGNIGKATPLGIFGALALLSGLLSLFLPETLDTQLPDTIKDVKGDERKQRQRMVIETNIDDPAVEKML